jgi:hypothetical protein
MKFANIHFKEANQYVPWIVAVGLALGVASFSLGFWDTLGQALVQQTLISLVIGYGIFVALFNRPKYLSIQQQYLFLAILFIGIGILGTEIERLAKAFLFQQGEYQFPNTDAYLFNGILTLVLGGGFYAFVHSSVEKEEKEKVSVQLESRLTNIPIRQGESTQLVDLNQVVYFEAYDNYSFLYDLEGNKQLCNYSLRYLEDTLGDNFIRVHRKYLINRTQIHTITPHFKGRFVIKFKDQACSTITSSSSYTDLIKGWMKI